MTEPRTKVEMLLGRHHGHTLEVPKSEAENLVMTGQARHAVETPEDRRPRAETPEQPATRSLDQMSKDELVALAAERGVDVVRGDGEDGDPLKADYVAALSGA